MRSVHVTAVARRVRGVYRHIAWNEVSGALGDLGTFLPLVVALTQVASLDLGTTLWMTGFYNVVTGLLYDLPVPVQPMKTIAAVALSGDGLTIPEMMAAGIFVSGTVLVLGATGLMGVATRLIPAAVIRGMQLGVGLQLAQKGFGYIWYETDGNGKVTTDMNSIFGVNGIFVGLFFVAFILLSVYNVVPQASVPSSSSIVARPTADSVDSIKGSVSTEVMDGDVEAGPRIPCEGGKEAEQPCISRTRDFLETRLLRHIFMAGDMACQAVGEVSHTEHLANQRPKRPPSSGSTTLSPSSSSSLACVSLPSHNPRNIPAALVIVIIGVILVFAFDPSIVSTLSLGPSTPSVIVPTATEWKTGILRAGLPQLPLTMLNSVISVTHLANQWFPDRYMRPGSIATSVGLMNLVGCWFGAFPSCHGAGGLAAQVRFGARWGTAPVLLGLFKIFISLLFGSSLIGIFQAFSTSILGSMLVFSGIELASVAKGQRGERGTCVMLLVAAIGLSTKNIAIGVLIGLVSTYMLAIWDFLLDKATKAVEDWKQARGRMVNNDGNVNDFE